jgi:hypothetical protein
MKFHQSTSSQTTISTLEIVIAEDSAAKMTVAEAIEEGTAVLGFLIRVG